MYRISGNIVTSRFLEIPVTLPYTLVSFRLLILPANKSFLLAISL